MAARTGRTAASSLQTGRASTGTSLQSGRASYYAAPAGQRTVTVQGAGGTHMAGMSGRQVAYQSPSGQRVQAAVPSKTYHRVILAEFAACVVLIAAAPVLTPRTRQSGGQEIADATASLAGPLVRLTAVCILFFVLALMASGPRSGKAAAAFGGLVVLGALLNATDMLTALAKAFTGAATGSSASSSGGILPTPAGGAAPVGTAGNPIGEG
jgi:hypothetical protein